MFRSVLIANRGEIAARIIRTLQRLDIRGDRHCLRIPTGSLCPCGWRTASCVWGREVSPRPISISDAIIAACHESGAEAVHPGYGFLSENALLRRMFELEGADMRRFGADEMESLSGQAREGGIFGKKAIARVDRFRTAFVARRDDRVDIEIGLGDTSRPQTHDAVRHPHGPK